MNQFERAARAEKAVKLAVELNRLHMRTVRGGMKVSDEEFHSFVRGMDQTYRDQLARDAGVPSLSSDTWAKVISIFTPERKAQ